MRYSDTALIDVADLSYVQDSKLFWDEIGAFHEEIDKDENNIRSKLDSFIILARKITKETKIDANDIEKAFNSGRDINLTFINLRSKCHRVCMKLLEPARVLNITKFRDFYSALVYNTRSG